MNHNKAVKRNGLKHQYTSPLCTVDGLTQKPFEWIYGSYHILLHILILLTVLHLYRFLGRHTGSMYHTVVNMMH